MFLPGESQGRGSLVGFRLWGRTESDTTEATQQQQQNQAISISIGPIIREGNGTHSNTLAWKIPWTEEPGGLQSVGSQRV